MGSSLRELLMMRLFFNIFILIMYALTFADNSPEDRYQLLIHELYCPVCSGQTLFESNHPVATEIKLELQELLAHDYSDEDIKKKFIEQYGDSIIHYKNNVQQQSVIVLFFIVTFLFLTSLVKKNVQFK